MALFKDPSVKPDNQNQTPIVKPEKPFAPQEKIEFDKTSVPLNSLYTFDDNKDRLLDKRKGRLFRYSALDHYIYDQRKFEPTKDIPLQEVTVDPTREVQQVTPGDGYYGLGLVIVNPIPEYLVDVSHTTVTPDDVVAPKIFVDKDGVTQEGTLQAVPAVDVILDTHRTEHTYSPGIYNEPQTVSIDVEQKYATPRADVSQNILPEEGKVLGEVIVRRIPFSRELNDAGGYTVTIA